MENVEQKGKPSGEVYTQDGTVDLRGNPVLRSNTGRWRATSFIIGMSQDVITSSDFDII